MRITKKRAVVTIGLALSLAAFGSKPSQAATLAISKAEVRMYDFSYLTPDLKPLAIAFTDTDTSSKDGKVTSEAKAQALAFEPETPNETYNFSHSEAKGKGSNYFGLAESFANVEISNFLIPKDTTFSFKFDAFLKLKTSIDILVSEVASADGIIDFRFLDQADEELDNFLIFGNISSGYNHDFLDYNNSDSITFDTNASYIQTSFGGTQENAVARIVGTYARKFTEETVLTIQEVKYNHATVQVPEPVSCGGMAMAGVMGWWMKRKRKGEHD